MGCHGILNDLKGFMGKPWPSCRMSFCRRLRHGSRRFGWGTFGLGMAKDRWTADEGPRLHCVEECLIEKHNLRARGSHRRKLASSSMKLDLYT